MIIDQVQLHNFGLYQGKHTVKLTPPSAKKPITLFGGLNGAGKTTFLDALQLALYGKHAQTSSRGNLGYHDYLSKCINRDVSNEEGAAIHLTFRTRSDGEEQTIEVRRSWRHKSKTVREFLEIFRNGQLDPVLSEAWDEQVEEFIPARISNLFFFDGEKIEGFANEDTSAELLGTAMHSLLGLDLVDRLSQDLVALERRKKADLKPKEEQLQIEEQQRQAEQLDTVRQTLLTDRASLQNTIDQHEKSLKSIERKYKRQGGALYESRKVLETERNASNKDVETLKSQLRALATGPLALAQVTPLLKQIAEQSHKERNAETAQLMLSGLDKRDTKLLKMAKSKKGSPELLKALGKFLKDDRTKRADDASVQNYLELSDKGFQQAQGLVGGTLAEVGRQANELRESLANAEHTLTDLDRKLAAIPEKDAIAELIRDRETARTTLTSHIAQRDALDEQVEKNKRAKELVEQQLAKLIGEHIQEDFNSEDTARVVNHASKVRSTLDRFRSRVVNKHTDRIEELVLDSYKCLLRKKSLITGIKIDPNSFRMELEGPGGDVISPDRLSAGERQLLAISILWGLGRASGRPLPAIIDTPLGRLDSEHRTHLIERYFPYASHQVILLSTDEEIEGEYFQKLKPWIGHSYTLEYNEKTASTEIQNGYFS